MTIETHKLSHGFTVEFDRPEPSSDPLMKMLAAGREVDLNPTHITISHDGNSYPCDGDQLRGIADTIIAFAAGLEPADKSAIDVRPPPQVYELPLGLDGFVVTLSSLEDGTFILGSNGKTSKVTRLAALNFASSVIWVTAAL